MQSKPLNFLYAIGQRNTWLVVVVTVLLFIVKILSQLPYSPDGSGYLDFPEIPETIDRVVQFAAFSRHEDSYVDFYGQLTFLLILLTWVLLIVGIIRYFGEKRSVTVLKLVALFVLWQGLFEVLKLTCFTIVNPFEGSLFEGTMFESYFSFPLIAFEIILPVLLSAFLLGMLSPTQHHSTELSEETTRLNLWQRGFHYFMDRLFIWFCGYNLYVMSGFSSGKTVYLFTGLALFLSQLIILIAVSEWFFGITLTKIITGSEVVRKDGKPITLIQAIARSVIRIIPFGWLSIFGKTPWIDDWTGTEVRYVSKDEPLLRLHKCVQLGTGILFFFGSWFLVIIITVLFKINDSNQLSSTRFFPFFILLIVLFFIPFLQSFWLATVVSYYRAKRDGKAQRSNNLLVQTFYCWIPIMNFYYLGVYLDEITSHMEHLGVSEEENDRIAAKIKRFSNVFGLTSIFILGLFFPLFINSYSKGTFVIAGLISVLLMIYAFFAWNLSRALKNTVVKPDQISELIDDLG
ncbi:MAG: RDD family protein [Bacteroidota bacterium]